MTLLLGLTLKQIPLPSWASVRLWRAETQDLRTYFVSNLQRQGRKRILPKKVFPHTESLLPLEMGKLRGVLACL